MSMHSDFERIRLKAEGGKDDSLELQGDGLVITRSRTRDGRLHVQTQLCPSLVPWIVSRVGKRLPRIPITIQTIPEHAAHEFDIPTCFAIFVRLDCEFPVLITREPLPEAKLARLLSLLPRVTAVLNAGEIYVPVGPEKLAKDIDTHAE